MTREALYVLASRARERTTLYVATHDTPYDEDDRTDQARTDPYAYAAHEILYNIIATDSAPLSATETITTAQEESGSLATLVPRYQHAACQQAEHRYKAAAIQALGDQDGSALVSDPAWDAVARRLHDAEDDGWDPVRLLALVGRQRELDSADSLAEVLAWRLDAHLNGTRVAPRYNGPYETMSAARDRLTEVTRTTLGPRISERAQAELAWPALLVALHRADSAGLHPAELLSHLANGRELRTAQRISEELALRIHRHLATHQDAATGFVSAKLPLPWMASQCPASGSPTISRYLTEAANLISSRVTEITSTAIRHRPPWMQALGQPPDNPEREREWLNHVAIVAAFREQFTVTTDDPAQPLGQYAEPGSVGHKPYWQAAESAIAARRLAELQAPASTATPDAKARAQVASDIYRALPIDQRAEVSRDMADSLGRLRFCGPAELDEEATQPVHAVTLISALARRGHVAATEPAKRKAVSGPLTYLDLIQHTTLYKPIADSSEGPLRSNGATTRLASSLRAPPLAGRGHQPRLG